MLSFSEASKQLERGRNGTKKLENNTYLHAVDANTIGVKLHGTDVVLIHKNGKYTLDSGGWKTPTTKDRINEYSPARILQTKGLWYVGRFLFEDGMKINTDGSPVNPKLPEAMEKKKSKLDKMVKTYIDGFAESVKGVGLTIPSGGCCWLCLMGGPEQKMGHDHLISHMKERYYVPSLLVNAITLRGGTLPVIWSIMDADVRNGRLSYLKSTLRSYFKKLKPKLLEYV